MKNAGPTLVSAGADMNEKYGHSPQVLQQFMETSRQYLTAPTIEQGRPRQPARRADALTRSDSSPEANYRRGLQGTASTLRQRFP